MAHLGADVAAFVDGQLSVETMRETERHLQTCESCARAVRQQRLLKSRMSTVATPEPPAGLIASLSGLAAEPPPPETWWARVRRSVPFRAGVVVAGASIAIVATAYAVGGPGARLGDEVVPEFDRYAADFHGATAVQAATVMSDATMDALDADGWPCHATLAGDLERTSGALADGEEIVVLSYSNGVTRLNLFEQNGVLDVDALAGFREADVAGARVWVRDGLPTVVTWDDEGVVYTIVTDADARRIERAVETLPTPSHERGLGDRVGDGLTRMTTWVGAA